MRAAILVLATLIALSAAHSADPRGDLPEPRLEPLSGQPPFPPDNPPTPEKIRLGKELFFENALSGNGRRSCSTCHKPELNFMDGFSRAWGLNETELRRKTPGLFNVGWQRSMFFDGRVKTLEEQVSKPLENPHEMAMNPEEAAARIALDPYYRMLFKKAFPGEEIRFELIAKAVASYERTLISYDSDLDRYLQGDEAALSPEARRGMELFSGKAGCINCHHGPLLTDHRKHYTGVPEHEGDNPPGTKYKTQSLRDVMRCYSFMHNGELLKIAAVLDHYEGGGSAPEGLKAEIEPFELSQNERRELVAFLWALNGRVNNLIEGSPESRDVFSITERPRRGPVTSDQAPQDPSYLEKTPAPQQEAVSDPNYLNR